MWIFLGFIAFIVLHVIHGLLIGLHKEWGMSRMVTLEWYKPLVSREFWGD